jgi:pimeloyl-ACP methyl ester carboxylesterase
LDESQVLEATQTARRLLCIPNLVDPAKPNSTNSTAWRIGFGAGVVGALCVALKYALRPPTRLRVPDAISPRTFRSKVIHTSLGEVVYHEAGTGQPIIFVHNPGLGASSYEWARVYPAFAGGFRVIALDLVGFGESSRPNVPFTGADYVRMLEEFIRELALPEAPIVVASGLSAAFCADLAAHHPALVSRLILHMPSATGHSSPQRLGWFSRFVYRTPLLARFLYRNHLSTRASIAQWLRKAAFVQPGLVTEETVDVYATCAQQPGAEYAALQWLAGRLSVDLEAALQAVTQPIALTWGGAVAAEPLTAGRRLQELSGAASFTVFPEGGCLAARESSAEMIAALREHLRGDLRVMLKAS